MAYNNQSAKYVVFDLETVSLPECAQYLDLPKAPSNWKDPAKIKAHCDEKAQEQLENAGLDPDLCQIVAIGWMEEGSTIPTVLSQAITSEADMLTAFWRHLDDRATVGFNNLGFDLPVLLRRSVYLGVHAPVLNLDRYRTPHLDLQQRLSYNGLLKYRGLGWYCRRFGICQDFTDTATGKDIAALVASESWADVILHCQNDVLRTNALATRLGLIARQPDLVPEEVGF
jgi:DNA polymerase III epsilon subunit-like protein